MIRFFIVCAWAVQSSVHEVHMEFEMELRLLHSFEVVGEVQLMGLLLGKYSKWAFCCGSTAHGPSEEEVQAVGLLS